MYDSVSLAVLDSHALLPSEQPDGVPWLAIDASRKVLYTSHYENVTQINIYDVESFAFIGHLNLSTTFKPSKAPACTTIIFMSPYEDNYSIYSIALDSGAVSLEVMIDQGIREIEGINIIQKENSLFPRLDVLAIKDIDNVMNKMKIRLAQVLSFEYI